jgi:endonuclease/exonuclease/phosphatase (EEP) superfamily protein YafD
MPYRVHHITKNYFGIDLFSKFPLIDSEVRFFSGENVPAILTRVRLPSGAFVRFFGIHPRPPHVGQTSADRDAQLMWAALAARQAGPPVVLAGDLNSVPWERTVWRLLRLGRLLEPRVGRGYWASYNTHMWLVSWPLDYVVFQDRIALMQFEILPAFGSDHYPIFGVLCLAPEVAARQPAPPLAPNDLQEARTAIQRGRSAETHPPHTP